MYHCPVMRHCVVSESAGAVYTLFYLGVFSVDRTKELKQDCDDKLYHHNLDSFCSTLHAHRRTHTHTQLELHRGYTVGIKLNHDNLDTASLSVYRQMHTGDIFSTSEFAQPKHRKWD